VSYVFKIPAPSTLPDDALLFFDEGTNEYYVLTDSSGNILTWENA
jgi:hypothetical protein